jgi:hypothetical protein
LVKKTKAKKWNHKHGILAITGGAALLFVLGVWAGFFMAPLKTAQIKTAEVSEEIVGVDGLFGLVGYSEPFKLAGADKINYTVTYKNNSSNDHIIEIKATQRSSNMMEVKGHMVVDPGHVTGIVYSDKALVKKGESKDFYVTIVQTKDDGTRYVELEAFKAE